MSASGGTDDDQIVAILLTMVFPGLGHYYLGFEERAIWWIVGITCYYVVSIVLLFVFFGILFLFLAPLVHLLCLVDVIQLS